MKFTRASGILCHPTSLPSKYGIGDLGQTSYDFVDFLAKSNQKLWQVLPLGPTGYGDSPYQCFSAFAGNPYLISPDILLANNLLNEKDLSHLPDFTEEKVDYGKVISWKISILKKAFSNYKSNPRPEVKLKFLRFCKDNDFWLMDYALFMSLKEHFNNNVWENWENNLSNYNNKEELDKWNIILSDEIIYHKWVQYIFFSQWHELKYYANSKEIKIIGDLPIFVAYDSADLWSNPELFIFSYVAGVPPDYFSQTGQLWGNPHYNWDKMKEDEYKWWRKRFILLLEMYDIIRIDHFRGFEAAWYVPYGEDTAIKGNWVKAPGFDFFEKILKSLRSEIPIIAENLGVITKEVEDLRNNYNFPGMKILQFAFEDMDSKNSFLPHNYERNCVAYTGTHDNDTTIGWFNSMNDEIKNYVLKYLNSNGKRIHWDFIISLFSSSADTVIIPLQDLLGMDTNARMNFPSTLGNNWQWRVKKDLLTDEITHELKDITILYGR